MPADPNDGFQGRQTLRFLTCGSVDDGKSTLIGRLLLDAGLVADDAYATLARDSARSGGLDPSLLLDGLEAEREQGITIDAAFRYFRTPRRCFIVADAPGHEQHTRNMAVAASAATLAVLLVDVTTGVSNQTRRHADICAAMGIRHVILAVNKMDLVGFAEATFTGVVDGFQSFAARLAFEEVIPVPVSARCGDNVAIKSGRMPWYAGETLLEQLETIDTEGRSEPSPFRFPVQWVNRSVPGVRFLAGTVAGGTISKGEPIVVLPSGRTSAVAGILGPDGDVDTASCGEAIAMTLDDQLDVMRGDILADPLRRPPVADRFTARVIWLDDADLLPGRLYRVRCGHAWTNGWVGSVRQDGDGEPHSPKGSGCLRAGDIGICKLLLQRAIAIDTFSDNGRTGTFIFVDLLTNRTAGCGMIVEIEPTRLVQTTASAVTKANRASLDRQTPRVVWFTGLSGAGKTTIANLVESRLHELGRHTYLLDGDDLRGGLNRDLGFSDADRSENIRRAAEVARLFVDAGLIVLCTFISPFRADRAAVSSLFDEGEFVEVFVDTSLEECIRRDPKGLYKRALNGHLPNFTGIGSVYERPETANIVLRTSESSPSDLADCVIRSVDWSA